MGKGGDSKTLKIPILNRESNSWSLAHLFFPHIIYTFVLKMEKAVSWVVDDYLPNHAASTYVKQSQFIFVSLLCYCG